MNYLKNLFCFILSGLLLQMLTFLPLHADPATASALPLVLVTVPPHQFFVQQIAGDTVQIQLLVPPGASSHTFEPSPKQMVMASHADLWFGIGEAFETKMIRALQSHKSPIKWVDLRQGVALISDTAGNVHAHVCNHPNCADLHIWLSPKQAKIQAQTIAKALSEQYPEHREEYQKRLAVFLENLDRLDSEMTEAFKPLKTRVILVSHPSYTYLARDYQLQQLSIEFEGKDPTPRQLTTVIEDAKRAGIKTVFIQPQYPSKGARLIAQSLGADVVELNPYSEDYFVTMRAIVQAIVKAGSQ